MPRDRGPHPFSGADRHRGLRDDDLALVEVVADRARHREHVLQIRRPSSPGGVPTAMNMTWAPRTADATSVVNADGLRLIALHHRLETGLVDRNLVALQPRDLLRVSNT